MQSFYSAVAALALALALCGGAAAQDREKAKSNREQGGRQPGAGNQSTGAPAVGERVTVRGKVVGVTLAGEAVIDPTSRKAIVAEAKYLTILGSPVGQEGQGGQAQRDQPRNAETREVSDQAGGATNRGRDNIYIVALNPKTTVRAGQARQGEAQQPGTAEADFESLEIGDRVEVVLTNTGQMTRKGSDVQPTADDQQTANQHGRSRVYMGEALSITILPGNAGQRQSQGQGNAGQRTQAQESQQ